MTADNLPARYDAMSRAIDRGARCSPGSIPNWQPATTPSDYLRNCRDALEEYSDRRFAYLMGWSRIRVYRARLIAEISGDLFEQLMDAGVLSSKALANIGLAFQRGKNGAET